MNRQSENAVDDRSTILDDCWNKIGVAGDATCPELPKYLHCRNCPKYAAAASFLLDRELPAGYMSDWSAHVAKSKSVAESATQSAVVFRLGAEWLALPTSIFQEVGEWKTTHSLPGQRSSFLLGMTSVNGELLLCISLAKVLNLEEASGSGRRGTKVAIRRSLIIEREGLRLAVPVDEVHGVYRYSIRDQMPLPATISQSAGTYTRFILSWKENTVGYLDDELLFHTVNRSLA